METAVFIHRYWQWHYTQALRDIWSIWGNLVWFFYNFFSIKLLLATIFSPWKRMNEPYGKGFDPKAFFTAVIVNILMRMVGFGVKAITIGIALGMIALVSIIGAFVLLIWVFMPVTVIASFLMGITFLVT